MGLTAVVFKEACNLSVSDDDTMVVDEKTGELTIYGVDGNERLVDSIALRSRLGNLRVCPGSL